MSGDGRPSGSFVAKAKRLNVAGESGVKELFAKTDQRAVERD
jgi:hypothetical protein